MSATENPLQFECEECGYALTELAVEGCPVRCPECGREYGWPPPSARAPWPGWGRMIWMMFGPDAVVLAVGVPVLCIGPDSPAIVFALLVPLLIACWFLFTFFIPAYIALDLTEKHVLKRRRARVARRLVLGAWVGNLLASALIVWLALSLAGWLYR